MDCLHSQQQVGGWPVLNTSSVLPDADGDTMPDIWETTHALDPNNPDDRNADPDRDGYTSLEQYLNELCCPANRGSD
jgi:hypothetical protein